jgi:glycosyltransferase involved in cell wall biosynthesis
MAAPPHTPIVLHYTGYDEDRGGIMSVIGALAETERFHCVLGVNQGFKARRFGNIPVQEFTPLSGERLNLSTLWRARTVAREVQNWLADDTRRVFHGHSRAGLAVALQLPAMGERRVMATVHCYGRHTWYYRRAARILRDRLYWLSPAMMRYYKIPIDLVDPWTGCLPGCVSERVRPLPAAEETTALRLGGIGTLTRWKQWHVIIEALDRLPIGLRGQVVFRHIGGTDGTADSLRYAAELRRQVADRGLTPFVEWCGERPSSDDLLAACDVLVVASKQEPFSVSILEALISGVPVVAANSGGAPDIIDPPRNGLLFEPNKPRDLVRAIGEMSTLIRNGVRVIDSYRMFRFLASTSAEQHLRIYWDVLADDE